jgi:inosine-uridine nucleoside N-ribohydrolase
MPPQQKCSIAMSGSGLPKPAYFVVRDALLAGRPTWGHLGSKKLAGMSEIKKRRIILDTDPAMGEHIGLDIDDDLAIVFLLNSPEVEIVGVTTTYGNSSSDRTWRDAKRLLARAGRPDIPVLKGAGWTSRDLNRETEASRFIAETVREQPGELTVLTLGPLTNLATAMKKSPGLLSNASELVMMGGRLEDGKPEFNFSAHPDATAAVLADPCPTFLVTLDLCLQVRFTAAHLSMLVGNPELVLAPWVGAIRRWLLMNRLVVGALSLLVRNIPSGGFFPWDGIAAAYLIAPDLFTGESRALMTMGGRNVKLDQSGADDPRAVRLPTQVDAERFMNLFMDRIGSLTVG